MEPKDFITALGLVVTIVLALVGWRIQLIGKRRTEIAEEALLGFARACDAIQEVRAPFSSSAEQAAMREVAGLTDADPSDSYRVVLWRMHKRADRFSELRRLQLLCRFHFGPQVDRAFETLQDARSRIHVAGEMLLTMPPDRGDSPDHRALQLEWRGVLWGIGGQSDKIAADLAQAQDELEAALVIHLRADAALIPVVFGWQAGWSWAKAKAGALKNWGTALIWGKPPS